ncbi:MAG: relaxase/mobilization nuclease domain-containing protein [Desulfovibrionaceae bacterium]|nr:relaxase/mobilization nuclease domain-containing protein [Desulfovibrionaceae bacterium]MBF0515321.1 relaxase/mobilization nuclease domain-containing protein [Desulfovibrionaceae bacterium]
MISRRVHQKPENDDYRRLSRYIAAADHAGEKSMMRWCEGCAAGDDFNLAIQEVVDTQALNTRTTKEKTYHLIISFRPEDEEKLTPEILKEIELEFAKALGFEEHQRHCGVHKNTNNLHMHVAYSMIHPEKLTRLEPFRDYLKRDKACRAIEVKFGLAIDNGRSLDDDSPKLGDVAATVEAQTGQQSFDGYAKARRDQILGAMEKAADWEQVHVVFAKFGIEIKPHGNGLVVKDRHGELAIKASSLDRSLSLGKLTKRFGEFAPPIMAKERYTEIERERFTARPLQRGADRDALYQEYQAGIEPRKAALEELKSRVVTEIAAVKKRWGDERALIEKKFFGKHRYELLKIARLREAEQRIEVRKRIEAVREEVRRQTPYRSWTDFLRLKSDEGNEMALAILRSKDKIVEAEARDGAGPGQSRDEVKDKWTKKRLELISTQNLSYSARKGLLAVSKAHELAELESLKSGERRLFTGFTSRIDTKGTVFIVLTNGGMIRDMGNKIFFSTHDEVTREAATLFAQSKWGKTFDLKGNILEPRPRELGRGQER